MIRQKIAFLVLGMLLPVALLNAAKGGGHSAHNQPTHKQQQKMGGMAKMNKKNVAPMATNKLSHAALAQTKMEAQTALKANNIAGLVDPVNSAPMQTAQLIGPARAAQVLQQPGLTPEATAALQAVAAQAPMPAAAPAPMTPGASVIFNTPAAGTASTGLNLTVPVGPTLAAPAAITPATPAAMPAPVAPATGPSMQGVDIVVNPQVPVLGGLD